MMVVIGTERKKAMKKGFEAVAKWKEQSDERREAFAQGYTPFFMMQDGESVEGLWFNGCPDSEPLVVDIHTLSLGGNKFRSVVHDPKNCIACHQRRGGDRRVSAVQQRAVFSVADPRWIHKVKDPEKSTAEKEKFQYVPCANDDDGDGKCKLCAKGHKRERSGQKRWEMSMTWGNALHVINKKLSNRCACGGKIRDGECQKCNDTTPLGIFTVPFDVDRTGASKNTTYQFKAQSAEPMPDWVVELSPPELDRLYKPTPADVVCELLGCHNPFLDDAESYDEADETFENLFPGV